MDEIAELTPGRSGCRSSCPIIIQAGLPTTTFASMPQLLPRSPGRSRFGNSLIVASPWESWRHHTLELSVHRSRRRSPGGLPRGHSGAEALPGRPLDAVLLADVIDDVGCPAGVL